MMRGTPTVGVLKKICIDRLPPTGFYCNFNRTITPSNLLLYGISIHVFNLSHSVVMHIHKASLKASCPTTN